MCVRLIHQMMLFLKTKVNTKILLTLASNMNWMKETKYYILYDLAKYSIFTRKNHVSSFDYWNVNIEKNIWTVLFDVIRYVDCLQYVHMRQQQHKMFALYGIKSICGQFHIELIILFSWLLYSRYLFKSNSQDNRIEANLFTMWINDWYWYSNILSA